MATIITKHGRFLARVRLNGHPPTAKTFDRRADALAWANSVEQAMRSGTYCAGLKSTAGDVPLLTFAAALRQYRQAVGDRLKGADTYAYWFDELAGSTLGPRLLRDITAFDVAAWRDEQSKNLKPSTVVRKLGLLGGFFSWAHRERGWMDRNPVHTVRKPRVSDARERVLTEQERAYLLRAAAAMRGGWLGDALTVLLASAMRRGELFALKRGDVDFDRSTAHLADTKNGSARDVPLCPEAREALRRLHSAAQQRGASRLLPLKEAHGLTLAFRRTIEKARELHAADASGGRVAADPRFLIDVRLHDLRHAAITRWAETGSLSMIELAAVSGHRSMTMLRRYAHLSASKLAGKLATIHTGAAAQGAAA